MEDLQELGSDAKVKKMAEEIAALNLRIEEHQKESTDLKNQISQLQMQQTKTHHTRTESANVTDEYRRNSMDPSQITELT